MEFIWKLNPWWEYKNWEAKDRHIKEFNSMKIRWNPRWAKEISLKPFSLNFVIGPRQVGKTTGIKLLIKKLLPDVKTPFQILYLDLELFTDLKELRKGFDYYFKLREREGIKNSYIFLDEVSYLDEWYRIVKGLIDLGEFEKDVIIATGSSTVNILKQAESFAGRRGKGKDIYALPLSFPEFLEVIKVNVKKDYEIREAFKRYVNTGGFPKPINDILSEDEFIKALEREITKIGKSVEMAKNIISTIFDMIPSALSYHSIAQKIGISHKTVESYLETFQDLFLLKLIYYKSHEVVFRKEKKIMFRDPFITRSLALWCGKEIRKDFLYENTVQEHLYRKFGEIYYYRNRYEIDCMAGDLKVEVKAGKPHRRYPKNVLVLEEEDIPGFLIELGQEKSKK
jgi:hypothetical protein